jgi:purine-binding chemotaxis protein CheW
MSTNEVLSTFYVSDLYCGIYTHYVTELTKGLEVTPVPLSPPAILGLLNLRGQIVTAIDMRMRLRSEPTELTFESVGIFYRNAGSLFTFVVDKVNEILELDKHDFEPPPHGLDPVTLDFVSGVFKLPGRLLLVLDPEKLVSGIR